VRVADTGRGRLGHVRFQASRSGESAAMQIPKELIVQELEKQGKSAQVQKALAELPDKIDHEQHAQMLEKLGIDPGKLAAEAAQKELGRL
jgi:antitoxin component of MazEF toxin-antitoxin module